MTEYEKERNRRLTEEARANKQRNIEMRKAEEANAAKGSSYSYNIDTGETKDYYPQGSYFKEGVEYRKRLIEKVTK